MPRPSPPRALASGLYALAAAASLVTCVAAAVLWVRSEAGPSFDFFVRQSAEASYGLGTEPGALIGFLQRLGPGYRDGDAADVQIVGAGFRYLRISSGGM